MDCESDRLQFAHC